MPHQSENTVIVQVLEEIIANGMDGLEAAVFVLINKVMQIEPSRALGAQPWQRSERRRGFANGYKIAETATEVII
jgi:putative transposase